MYLTLWEGGANLKLGQIASIKSGLVLTRKKAFINFEIENIYNLITLKNIKDNGAFNKEPFETFESNKELEEGYFTEEGEILVRLSYPYTAVHIDKGKAGLLVPSSFAIIKLRTADYIPEYVTWYLNSDQVKKELIKSQTGTAMSTTNKSILTSIDIKEMPIEDQKRIGKIQELYFREKELLDRLIEEKEKYYQAITNKLMQVNREGVVSYG